MDALLQADPEARERFREVHPEVCFWAWRGGEPIAENKTDADGAQIRLELAEAWLGAGVRERARGNYLKGQVADDDILDAIAALRAATRIAAGEAGTIPGEPPRDSTGLPMEMVY